METVVSQFGSLGPLLTAKATFYANVEADEDGFIRANTTAYLTDVPCMPATGRNTRQDGIVFVALAGTLPFESKWSAYDLTPATRNKVKEQDKVVIEQRLRDGTVISSGSYIVAGVTEFDDPALGFAFALLVLKDEK